MTDDTAAVSSPQLVRILGGKVTYRQLDYAVRVCRELDGIPSLANLGSGGRRRWPVELIPRLMVAAALAEGTAAFGGRGQSVWLDAVGAALRGPEPPIEAFAVLRPGQSAHVTYHRQLGLRDVPLGAMGAVVVHYRLDAAALELAKRTELTTAVA